MGDFPARIAIQEWWSGFGFCLLVAGLIGDIVVLAIPDNKRVLEKALGAAFTILIIVGCAFEYVADDRISALVAQEEAAAGVQIATLYKTANEAAKAAGELGVSLKGLDRFVGQKIGEINGSIGSLSSAERRLKVAQEKAQALIDSLNARAGDRHILPAQRPGFIKSVQHFAGTPFLAVPETGPGDVNSEQQRFAGELISVLNTAGWIPRTSLFKDPRMTAPSSYPIGDRGCLIVSSSEPEGKLPRLALVEALKTVNIDCDTDDDPVFAKGAVEIDIGLR